MVPIYIYKEEKQEEKNKVLVSFKETRMDHDRYWPIPTDIAYIISNFKVSDKI